MSVEAINRSGDVLQNAKVYLFAAGTTTTHTEPTAPTGTAVTGSVYLVSSGGAAQTLPITTGSEGTLNLYADTPQVVDVVVSSNNGAAYIAAVGTLQSFAQEVKVGEFIADPAIQVVNSNYVVWVSRWRGKDSADSGYQAYRAGSWDQPYRTLAAAFAALPVLNGQAGGEIHIPAGTQIDIATAPSTWSTADGVEYQTTDTPYLWDTVGTSGARGVRVYNHGGFQPQAGNAGTITGGNFKGSGCIAGSSAFPINTPLFTVVGNNYEFWNIPFRIDRTVTGSSGMQMGKDSGGSAAAATGMRLSGCGFWGFTSAGLKVFQNNSDASKIDDCYFGFNTSYGIQATVLSTISPNNFGVEYTTFWWNGPMSGGTPGSTADLRIQADGGIASGQNVVVLGCIFFGGSYAIDLAGMKGVTIANNQFEMASIGSDGVRATVTFNAGNTTVNASGTPFTNAMIGMTVASAGFTFGAAATTTIATRPSSSQVTLTASPDQTSSSGGASMLVQPVIDRAHIRVRSGSGGTTAPYHAQDITIGPGNFMHQCSTAGWSASNGVHLDVNNATRVRYFGNNTTLDTTQLTSTNPLVLLGSGATCCDIDVGRVDDESSGRTVSVADPSRLCSGFASSTGNRLAYVARGTM